MKRKRTVLLLILAVAFFSVNSVYAESSWKGHGEGYKKQHQARKAELYKELGLSEEQQVQIKEHRKRSHAQMKTIGESLKKQRENLRVVLSKYDADPAEIEKIASEIKYLHSQLIDHRIASILEVKTILSPEQFTKFQEKMNEFKKKMRQSRKGHRGGPGGGQGGGSGGGLGRGPGGGPKESKAVQE